MTPLSQTGFTSQIQIKLHRYLYPVDPTRLDQSGSMMDEEEESNVSKKKKKD